jgi:hypothetical protein
VVHADLLCDVPATRRARHERRWQVDGVQKFDEVGSRLNQ